MPGSDTILALHSRKSRMRAGAVAMAEALQLLSGLEPSPLSAGPLVEERVRCWIALDRERLDEAADRLRLVGYSNKVEALLPLEAAQGASSDDSIIRWQRRSYKRTTLVPDDADRIRSAAPDQRSFLLETEDGGVKLVQGYRGSSGPLERRGLSAVDARVLVNLVFRPALGELLDPFAGTGGIALAAGQAGWCVTTADIDPRLRFGLAQIADRHLVGDARRLPFASHAFDAIATEPPFHETQGEMLDLAFAEMVRVLRPGARLSVLAPQWEVDLLAQRAGSLPLRPALREPVDRRGDAMEILMLERL